MTIKLYYNTRLYNNRIMGEELSDPAYTFDNINFIQGDGINTTLTLNKVDADNGPSYLTSTDDNGVTTEWFVISSVKNRKDQLTLVLKRDLLHEKWNSIKDMPFLCAKSATINSTISEASYKKTTSLSQVKTSQELLRDSTRSKGCIVGFVDRNALDTDISGSTGATRKTYTATLNSTRYDYYYTGTDVNNWSFLTSEYKVAYNNYKGQSSFPWTCVGVPSEFVSYGNSLYTVGLQFLATSTLIDSTYTSEFAGSSTNDWSIPYPDEEEMDVGIAGLPNENSYIEFTGSDLIVLQRPQAMINSTSRPFHTRNNYSYFAKIRSANLPATYASYFKYRSDLFFWDYTDVDESDAYYYYNYDATFKSAMTSVSERILSAAKATLGTKYSNGRVNTLLSMNGKTLLFHNSSDNTDTYYKINVTKSTVSHNMNNSITNAPITSAIYNSLKAMTVKDKDGNDVTLDNLTFSNSYASNGTIAPFADVFNTSSTQFWDSTTYNGALYNFNYRDQYDAYTVSVTKINDASINVTLSTVRVHTSDTPYDIFAIPLGGNVVINDANSTTYIFTDEEGYTDIEETAMALVSSLQRTLTPSVLLDIQWLPYGPYTSRVFSPGVGHSLTDGYQFSLIQQDSHNRTILYWANSDEMTRNISTYGNVDVPSNLLEKRIFEEENYYRLVSPNYASIYEFSPNRNGGVTSYTLSCAFKPYESYIRVAPVFSNLYGESFTDNRGLILEGNFSLTQTTDQWQQYKLNNINYKNIFNRKIQSLDLQNEYQNNLANQASLSESIGILTNSIGALGQGISRGAQTGNGYVAGGLGMLNEAASLTTGIIDYKFNEKNRLMEKAIRDDNKQAAIDNFEYQIGNIKAMPNVYNKIDAFTPDFNVFPMLETYKCTAQEDASLRNAIKYNGIDINLMTTLGSFDTGFVQGSIMNFRSANKLNINAEQAAAINNELQQGIYIKEV